MSQNVHPLIDSLKDLANSPDIYPAVDKATGVDIFLMVDLLFLYYFLFSTNSNCEVFHIQNAVDEVSKKLGDKLRAHPESRCVNTPDCIELVASGRYVYISVSSSSNGKSLRKPFTLVNGQK